MKTFLFVFSCFLSAYNAPLEAANQPKQYELLASELLGLGREQILEKVLSEEWLELPALSLATREDSLNVETIASTALLSLRQEAQSIAELPDSDELLRRTLRAAAIANAVLVKGGYLNELIAVSAERVFLLGSWSVLDQYPELAQKLIPAIEGRRRLPSPKTWFLQRSELDPEVAAKRNELDAMKPDASGFQVAMQLRPKGKDASDLPTVFAQIEQPSVIDLWWEVYFVDFRVSAVLRSATDFVQRGGVIVPEPNSKPAAIEAVFGPDGPPYHHELRRGAIRSDDIWKEWKAARDESSRKLQSSQWFGKP